MHVYVYMYAKKSICVGDDMVNGLLWLTLGGNVCAYNFLCTRVCEKMTLYMLTLSGVMFSHSFTSLIWL